jgi:hypothetical protein
VLLPFETKASGSQCPETNQLFNLTQGRATYLSIGLSLFQVHRIALPTQHEHVNVLFVGKLVSVRNGQCVTEDQGQPDRRVSMSHVKSIPCTALYAECSSMDPFFAFYTFRCLQLKLASTCPETWVRDRDTQQLQATDRLGTTCASVNRTLDHTMMQGVG